MILDWALSSGMFNPGSWKQAREKDRGHLEPTEVYY